jgi:hypothetical protein
MQRKFKLTFKFAVCTLHLLFRFLMRRVLATEATVLAELEPLGRLLLVLRRAVVPALALTTGQLNDVSHKSTRAG